MNINALPDTTADVTLSLTKFFSIIPSFPNLHYVSLSSECFLPSVTQTCRSKCCPCPITRSTTFSSSTSSVRLSSSPHARQSQAEEDRGRQQVLEESRHLPHLGAAAADLTVHRRRVLRRRVCARANWWRDGAEVTCSQQQGRGADQPSGLQVQEQVAGAARWESHRGLSVALPALFTIHFGKYSCTSIYSFNLSSRPSHIPSLTDLPSLSVVFFGSSAFKTSKFLYLDSLPSLVMFEAEDSCFENGDLHASSTTFILSSV